MKLVSKRWVMVVLSLMISMMWVSAQEQSYTVQSGDTVQSIASRFNVSTDALLQYNGIIDPNRIIRGQVIRIPIGVVSPPQTHTVAPGENLQWIADRYGITLEALIDANDITNTSRVTVGRVLNIPASSPSVFTTEHIVQPGQTLRSIGELYGISWEELASVNNLANPNIIQVGQRLVVPAFSPAPAPTPVVVPTAVPQPTAVVVVQPPQAQPPQTQLRTYVVQVGDNPVTIAERFGVTLDSLLDLNDLRGNLPIFAGDILLIPPTGGAVSSVASPNISAGQYVVQPGDTLFEIAIRSGRNIYDIAAQNGLLNLNSIYIGQVLTIR